MKTSFTPPPRSIFALLAGESQGVQDGDDTTINGDAVSDTTFRPPAWSSVGRYVGVLSFALAAIALSDAMKGNYDVMNKNIAKSKQLLTHKSLDIQQGKELQNLAAVDAQHSEIVDANAKSLDAEGKEDIDKAKADQKKAQSLHDEAASEQSEAIKKRDEAAEDEDLYKSLSKNANTMIEMAEDDLAAANEACDFPFFRSICDLLGGTTRIRASDLAVQASQEARDALEEYERAMAARDREKEEIEKAKQLDEQAKQDEEESQQLGIQAENEMKAGEEEEREAEKMYADALEMSEKSAKEKGEADLLISKARDEKSQAETLHDEAFKSGKKAYIYGIFACAAAAISLILFAVRFVHRYGAPFYWGLREAYNRIHLDHKRSPNHGIDIPKLVSRTWSMIPKNRVVRFLVEFLCVLASVASFPTQWASFEEETTRARGSLVLLCALIAGFSQSITLSTLPALFEAASSLELDCSNLFVRKDTLKALTVNSLGHFALSLTIFLLLSAIYILIAWLTLGKTFITLVGTVNPFIAWPAFTFGSFFYFQYFSNRSTTNRPASDIGSNDDSSKSVFTYSTSFTNTRIETIFRNEETKGDATNLPTENDSLLDKEWGLKIGDYDVLVAGSETSSEPMDIMLNIATTRSSQDTSSAGNSSETPSTQKKLGTVLAIIIDSIGLPFELLVLTCMVAIIRTSIYINHAISFTWNLERATNLLLWLVLLVTAWIISFKQVVAARQQSRSST